MAERYLKKGKQIYISGKWKTRKWTDQAGNDRYSTKLDVGFEGRLQMLGDGQGGSSGQSSSSGSSGARSSGQQSSFTDDGFDDDEIPF